MSRDQRLLRGACLLLVYVGTAVVYLSLVVGGYAVAGNTGVLLGWTFAAALASRRQAKAKAISSGSGWMYSRPLRRHRVSSKAAKCSRAPAVRQSRAPL